MWGEIFAQVCYEKLKPGDVLIHHGTCRGESETFAVKGQCFQKSQKDEEFIYETFESQNHRKEEFGRTYGNYLVQPSVHGKINQISLQKTEMIVRWIIVLYL